MHVNQELSWLHFNRRVLDQTRRRDFPVMERVRFLSIWASNLDEFFAARISRPFLEQRGTASYQALLREARAQVDAAEQEGELAAIRAKLSAAELSATERGAELVSAERQETSPIFGIFCCARAW